MPPSAFQLCGILPPPNCFHGPFVILDHLMEKIKHSIVPEIGVPLSAPANPEASKLFELARSVVYLPKEEKNVERPHGKKRAGEESDEEEAAGPGGPPSNDIYRKRQQRRVK